MDGSVWRARERGFALWRGKPEWVEPMLPMPGERARPGDDWAWEPMVPGVRCLIWTSGRSVRLFGRGRRSLDPQYGELRSILGVGVRGDAILDGVIADGSLHLFDCLYYEGASLTPLPLRERKAVLRDAVWFCERVRPVPSSAIAPVEVGCPAGGAVAKRLSSPYSAGRSSDWLAFTSALSHEFVIGGYSRGGDARDLSILIGYYHDGRLRYAGRVGAACDPSSLAALLPTLSRLRRRTSPFGGAVPAAESIEWVSPALVAQVGFNEWTPAGRPRAPRFIGLRHDREPDEVKRTLP